MRQFNLEMRTERRKWSGWKGKDCAWWRWWWWWWLTGEDCRGNGAAEALIDFGEEVGEGDGVVAG